MSRFAGVVVGVAALAAVVLAATYASAIAVEEAGEQKVPLKSVPANVIAVVKVVCPEGTILSATKEVETKGDQVVTEYELKVRGADGVVTEVDVELDAKGHIRKVQVGEDDEDDGENNDKDDGEDDD